MLAAVTELYLAGQRVDITVVAARLGLGRATIYRWFGSREALLGEVVARQLELLVARKRAEVRRRGAAGLLEVLDRVNRTLTRSRAVRRLLEQERDSAMRMLTTSAGVVEPRAVACIQALIERGDGQGIRPPGRPRDARLRARAPSPRIPVERLDEWGFGATTSGCARSQAALLGVPVKPRGSAPRAAKRA